MSVEVTMTDAKDAILERLKLVAPSLIPKLTVYNRSEITGSLIHISNNPKPRKFVPAISRRGAKSEDATIPRVCVATTLAGAFIAYAKDIYDFEELSRTKGGWSGGYVIYTFNYEGAIRPSPKLVYDADITDEHWLVTYNNDTLTYTPVMAGKVFVKELRLSRDQQDNRLCYTRYMYVEILAGFEILWNLNRTLTPGHYRIVVTDLIHADYVNVPNAVIETITAGEYLKNKSLTASLLEYVEPPSAEW